MNALTLCNLKGGAGKTTSAVCLAEEVATRGHPVLVVDWDPQGTLSGWVSERGPSATNLARGDLSDVHRAAARSAEGARVDVVAADRSLACANSSKGATLARHLEEYLDAAVEGYEVALVDVQPSVGPLVLGALMATARALVPVEAGVGAMQGLAHVSELLQKTGAGEIAAAFAARVDVRRTLDTKARPQIHDHFGALETGGAGADTQIREAVSMQEAQAAGKWPQLYAPGSTPVTDYSTLTDELESANVLTYE
jgi:chromosome partitioning protein